MNNKHKDDFPFCDEFAEEARQRTAWSCDVTSAFELIERVAEHLENPIKYRHSFGICRDMLMTARNLLLSAFTPSKKEKKTASNPPSHEELIASQAALIRDLRHALEFTHSVIIHGHTYDSRDRELVNHLIARSKEAV